MSWFRPTPVARSVRSFPAPNSIVSAVLILLISACSDKGATAPPVRITDDGIQVQGQLTITPSTIKVTEGDSVALTVSYQGNSTFDGRLVTWTVYPPEIGFISSGLFITNEPGEATITARYAGITTTASAQVRPIPIEIVALGSQTTLGIAGLALPDSITVRVAGRNDVPVPDVLVTFEINSGAGTVSHQTRLTDEDGVAKVEWVLGAIMGTNSLLAKVEGLGDVPYTVESVANVETAELRVVAGDNQEGVVNQLLAIPLLIELSDASGNPVRGIPLEWSFFDGQGAPDPSGLNSGSSSQPLQVVTDELGRVAMHWQLGRVSGDHSARVAIPSALAAAGQAQAAGGGRKKDHNFKAKATPGDISTLDITPGWVGMRGGDQLTLNVQAIDKHGNTVDVDLDWSTSDAAIAQVDGSGTVSAGRAGTAVVIGKKGPRRDSTTVAVQAAGTVTMSPVQGSDQIGAVGSTLTIPLTVRVTDALGFVVEGRIVTWSTGSGSASSAQGLTASQAMASTGGSVSPAQGLTDSQGMASTTWTLGETAGGQSVHAATADVTPVNFDALAQPGPVAEVAVSPTSAVMDPGTTVQFSAEARDALGNIVPGAQIAWLSGDDNLVTVNTFGLATARLGGSTFVRASAGAKFADATVTVNPSQEPTPDPGQVTDLFLVSKTETSVTLRFSQVDDGTGLPADYVLRYAQGTLPGNWDASWPNEVTIPGTVVGALTDHTVDGLEPGTAHEFGVLAYRGTFNVDAVKGAPSNTVSTTTNQLAVATVTASVSIYTFTALEDTLPLSAIARDGAGDAKYGVDFAWVSSDPLVATVDGVGRVIARGVGTTVVVVTATCCAVSDAVSVVVSPLVEVIDLAPAAVTLDIGQSQQLTATPRDRNGYQVTGAEVTWSSDDPAVATVSSSGLATALTEGSTTVRAATGEVSATMAVTVSGGGSQPDNPAAVTDLAVVGTTDTSVTLEFTEVDDGTGQPAQYAIRYGSPTIQWSAAFETEVSVSGSSVGSTASYTYSGLQAGTDYEFQLVTYRGTLNDDAVFGPVSAAVSATTTGGGGGEGGGGSTVASVTASLEQHTFSAVGETLQVSASAEDSTGAAMSGVSFSWTSTDPSIASVDNMGLVTSQAVGTASIVVSVACCLAADTVGVTVEDGSGGGAAGPFFVENFETGDLSNTMGGFSWLGNSLPVRCGEQAFSGNCARRFGYRGVPDGQDGMSEQRFDIGVANKSTELWIEYQLYVPDNLVRRVSTGPNNDKFFFLWDENTYQTKRLHMEFLTLPGGSTGAATFSMKWADTQHSGISAWALRAPGFLAVDMRGTWVRIRYHAALGVGGGTTVQGSGSATRGQDGTGVFQLWVNDDLLIDVSTLSFDPIGIADPGFQKGYIFGWSNSGYDEDTIWYVDDFKVYKVQPGWN